MEVETEIEAVKLHKNPFQILLSAKQRKSHWGIESEDMIETNGPYEEEGGSLADARPIRNDRFQYCSDTWSLPLQPDICCLIQRYFVHDHDLSYRAQSNSCLASSLSFQISNS